MKDVRIAILGTHGIPAKYGGFETCVHEISTRLVKRGHEVTVYSKSDRPGKTVSEFEGVKLISLPKMRKQHADYAFHGFLTTLMAAASDADILHFFGCDHVPFTLVGRLTGKGVVLTVDGLEWRRLGYPFIYRAYLRSFAELAMVFPDVTVADSVSSQEWYHERSGVRPVHIPYGTSLSANWNPDVLSKFGLEPRQYILFVGRLVYEKGAHTLLEAFKRVNTDLKLAIVGDALTRGDYIQNLKNSADSRTVFLGYVHGPDFVSIRNAALIYVHPSLFDGTSISLLGALGSGRCVISSDLKENVDVGGDAAVYFEKENASSLARSVQDLLDNPEKIRHCEAKALSRARTLDDWNAITDRYEAAYRDALRKKRARP